MVAGGHWEGNVCAFDVGARERWLVITAPAVKEGVVHLVGEVSGVEWDGERCG